MSKLAITNREVDLTIPYSVDRAQRRRYWLVGCCYADNTWHVLESGNRKQRKLGFDVALARDTLLINNGPALSDSKRLCFELRDGGEARFTTGVPLTSAIRDTVTLRRWMAISGITAVGDLTSHHLQEYAEAAIYGQDSILDMETRVLAYVDALFDQLKIRSNHSNEERLHLAAAAGLQTTCYNGRNAIRLLREPLFRDIGLDGVNFAQYPGVPAIIDDFERDLGISVRPRPFDDSGERQPVSDQRYWQLLKPFEYLYYFRRKLEDPLSFDPTDDIRRARAMARRRTVEVKRTRSIPPAQAFSCITEAARYVRTVAPPLLKLGNSISATYRDNSKPGPLVEKQMRLFLDRNQSLFSLPANAPVHATSSRSHATTFETGCAMARAARMESAFYLDDEITKVQAACGILILTFTARRACEVISLKAGCISRDGQGRALLRVYIHKTIGDERVIPVPAIVVEAVVLLETISQEARRRTGKPYLFLRDSVTSRKVLGLSDDGFPCFRLTDHVKAFGFSSCVPSLESGERWEFLSHQFRKLFALLFVFAFKGSVAALSAFFFHFDIEMTRRYLEDPRNAVYLLYADQYHTAHVLAQAALGQIKLTSECAPALSERVSRLVDSLASSLQVVSLPRLASELVPMVEKLGVTVVPSPLGFCLRKESIVGRNAGHNILELVTMAHSSNPLPDGLQSVHKSIAANHDLPLILRQASAAILRAA